MITFLMLASAILIVIESTMLNNFAKKISELQKKNNWYMCINESQRQTLKVYEGCDTVSKEVSSVVRATLVAEAYHKPSKASFLGEIERKILGVDTVTEEMYSEAMEIVKENTNVKV